MSLALNLEFLQAEFYLRASTGRGLTSEERGHSGAPCLGGRRIEFANPLLAAIVEEFGQGERRHVQLLQSLIVALEGVPLAAPALDLATSFDTIMIAAGLGRAPQTFDAFTNETNFLLAAYIIEDVVVSSYRNALLMISDNNLRDHFAGILAAEASQSGIIRMSLFAGGFGDASNAISYHRQVLSKVDETACGGNDHGVGSHHFSGVVNADGNYKIWPRSERQTLNILYGGFNRRAGLFFPEGLNDADRSVVVRDVYADQVPNLAAERDAPIALLSSDRSETVVLPPLNVSEASLSSFDVRENVLHQPWSETSYISKAPSTFEIGDAVSHGAVGIVTIDDRVIQETMWHTDPNRHRYQREGDEIVLRYGREEFIAGTTVSILVGAAESYWHSMLDATARLVLVPDEVWDRVGTLLIPSTGIRQLESVTLFGIPPHVKIRSVEPDEVLRLESLIYPSSIHGLFDYHPGVMNRFYDRLLANMPEAAASQSSGPYIYLDRRMSPLRKLANEDDLVAALPDFEPTRLEQMNVVEQIALFRGAKIIVAPHGAGLTNIGFCKPGTIIIELMMDRYCNWCYRRIAAVRDLKYVCVLGRAASGADVAPSIHMQSWGVAVEDVVEIVSRFM